METGSGEASYHQNEHMYVTHYAYKCKQTTLRVVSIMLMLRLLTYFDLARIFNEIGQRIQNRLHLCISCEQVLFRAFIAEETSSEKAFRAQMEEPLE